MDLKNLLGFGREKLLASGAATTSTIEKVKVQYWMKVKDSPVNINNSAATYPAIVTVRYQVGDRDHTAQLWCSARRFHPPEGLQIPVWYDPEQPERCAAKF